MIEKKIHTTVIVASDLHKKIRKICLDKEKKYSHFVVELLEEEVKKHEDKIKKDKK